MNNSFLSTKQFADLCKVEKRTLFYYDEIDLLKPNYVGGNGYRYYIADQFDTMSMIKALQSIGMSLSDIKALMKEKDLGKNTMILKQQIKRLQDKQQELKAMEDFLIQTNGQIEHYLTKGLNRYFVEDIKDTYLVVEPHAEDKTFINYLNNGYHLGCIIAQYPYKYIPSYTYKMAINHKNSNWIKPTGSYASLYRTAKNGSMKMMMDEWMNFLVDKNIVTEGPLYLEDLASDFISMPENEIIFKLSIKISLILNL